MPGDKVAKLGLERDHKKYLYFVDGQGNVCRKPKAGGGDSEIVHANAVQRNNQHLYFIDKDGDVCASARKAREKKS